MGDLYDQLADRHASEIAVALELIVLDLARSGALPRSTAAQAGLLVHLVRVLQNTLMAGYIASQKDFLAEAREGAHPLDPQPASAALVASPTSVSDAK